MKTLYLLRHAKSSWKDPGLDDLDRRLRAKPCALKGEALQKNCRYSSGKAELVKEAVHGHLYDTVVGVDGSRVVRAASWAERLSGSEQGFDGFVAKHQEGGDCAKAGRECVVPASAGDPLNDLFAAEFFEIVGSVAGAVRKRALFAEKAHPSGEVGGGEAVGRGGQGDECFNDVAHARLVEIDATDEGLADA